MQVYPNQLAKHLQGPLQAIYLVFGDDDFLRLRALGEIRQRAQQLGFDERQQFNQQQDFSWSDLTASSQNLSLFSSLKIIELEMPTAAPGNDGSKALQAWVENDLPDTLLLIHGPKLKADQQKAKWFKSLTSKGVFIPVYTPDRTQLPGHINQLAHGYQLRLDNEAIVLLTDWFEGNLLALDQALHKLSLHYPATGSALTEITSQHVRDNAELQSRFDIFSLQDPLLNGQFAVFVNRLQRLLETDAEPAIIHWLLQRECNQRHQAYLLIQAGKPLGTALQKQGIWKSQHGAYGRIVQQWNFALHEQLIDLLWRAELAIKRDSGESLATLFCHIGLLLSGQTPHTLNQLHSSSAMQTESW
ncbi:MAG: DNA polymerase III subunit delta [Idiomarina sp.]|nr:DNA polymerase III subunit delta [Idiomarina sp.]